MTATQSYFSWYSSLKKSTQIKYKVQIKMSNKTNVFVSLGIENDSDYMFGQHVLKKKPTHGTSHL